MLVRAVPYLSLVLTLVCKASCQGASLTFVIDDTRSMGNDIAQVRNEVDSIMDIVLNEKTSQISNIVLVTFNDPAVRVRKITNSREELKKAMALVRVNNYFNYDCPEMALSGIKLALESSLPGSYIYVFTDASAKDYKMSEEIQQLCQRKQSQVVFVLTGDCKRPHSKRFQVYYDIATASSGLAFRVDKKEVEKVLHTIRETIKGNKTVLTSKVTPPDVYTDVPFWIDDLTEYAIVSASGADVSLEIRGPSGAHTEFENIMWTKNGKVIKIKNPYPGQYVATVKGSSSTSVVINGRSDFLFHHGFSEQEPKSIDDTAPQPFSDTLTHLSLSVTDPKHSVRIQSAQILDMKENVIKTFPLKELSPNFYTTGPFAAPSEMFKIAVIGEAIQTGKPVRRIAKIPVTPQKAPPGIPLVKTPVVEIKEGASVEVARGAPLTLTCKVSAYPPPEITWRDSKGITVVSTSSRVQIPYDYISYLKISKASEDATYYCHAKNVLNNNQKSVKVVTKHPITINSVPKDSTKIAYGAESKLNCDVTSPLPLEIKWYHVIKSTGKTEEVKSSTKYSISSDGKQLKISSMDVELVGKYTCKAHVRDNPSEQQEISTNVEIHGLVPPKIDPDTKQVTVQEHMPASIKCKISKGIPEPKITWLFKASGSASSSFQTIPGSGAELRIPSAGLMDEGSYRCVASNAGGRDELTVAELVVLKAPVVVIKEGADVTVPYGGELTLTCQVTSNPPPKIIWSNEGGALLTATMSGSKNEFEYTYKTANMKESGKYVCRAENNQGIKTESIQVTVLPAFTVHSHPPDNLEIPYGNRIDLKCDIKSTQPMKIEWFYAFNSTEAGRRLSVLDKVYELSSDGTLQIKSMDVDLTGTYTCKASLISDPSVTNSYTTNVDIRGLVTPEINPLPLKIEINETDSTIIPCKILRAVPKPKISWQMKAVGSTEYLSIAGSGSELHVERAALGDGGHYKCVAENVAGRREQVVAELVVLKAPALVIVEGASMEVPYGSQLTLTCRVTANPEPTVVWKDSAGNTIPDTSSEKNGFEYTHTIKRANVKESDKYSCTAINNQGPATNSIQVSVASPFKVDSHPSDSTSGKYGSDVSLKCNIKSNFPMKIRWYRVKESTGQKKEIVSSKEYMILLNGAELKINAIDVGQDGKYTCKASLLEDPDKQVEYTTQVKIEGLEKPEIDGDAGKSVKVGSSVSMKCNVIKGVPKPEISWQFMEADSHKFAHISNTGNELHIANAKVEDSGYYTCAATNSLGTTTHTISLTVEVPARIVSDEFAVYEGLIGDIALRIPCDAVGNPKPTFEWKVNGAVVTPGTKYDIEDGALIVKHPERSYSNYTCTVTNIAGSDTKTFTGVVDDTLTDDGTIHEVFILRGESKNITSSLPHSDPSTAKWFIEPQHINYTDVPYVTVVNATLEDDGNYTYHVSDSHGSATETFVVDVGYPPRFKYSQDPIVEWSGDLEDALSCSVIAKPEANVAWTFNGKPLPRASFLELNIFNWGHYSCNVSNVHGSVQREFEVTPTVCLISRNKEEATHMPLMLTEYLTWPDYGTSGEYMIMRPGDKLMLSCHNDEKSPNSFQKFPALSELEATCNIGDSFMVDGKLHKLKDLACTNTIYPSVVRTGTKCLTDTSEFISVGYNLIGFVEAYEVCFDHAKNMPLYIRMLMSQTNNVPSPINEWFQYPEIGNGRPEPYTCETPSSTCCYAKSQLVNARDFSYGPVQNSSFIYPLNAIPYWRPCSSDRTSWENVEDMVRSELKLNPNFVVWSGVHELQERNGTVIPRYLWKVVRESEIDSAAIVYVNDGSPKAGDIKCENKCAEKAPWFDTRDSYTYCCTVADFIEGFKIPGNVVGESFDQLNEMQTYT